ncbi:MAG: HEAT repeat domain-containing protein, partial [Ignavibacteriae bacterium]|nr:HEAT repeat domain-containing protein [Ignavibacteriota bacterium]
YEYGLNRTPLADLSLIVKQKLNGEKSDYDLETKLLDVLKTNASFDGKQFLCKQLSLIGTEKSIEQLIVMLEDSKTSDMARYALEKIKSENVDIALIDILDNVEPEIKIGIINSLGNRKSEIAVDKLGKLVLDNNSDVAASAASALGKIGSSHSAEVLSQLLNKTKNIIHDVLIDSYLLCADKFLLDKNNKAAEEIYSNVLANENSSIQKIAALNGIVFAAPSNKSAIILKYLQSDDPQLNQAAAQEVRKLSRENEFKNIVTNFNSFNDKTKIQVLYSIKELQKPYFHNLVLTNAEKASDAVRIAAIDCLEKLATVDDVKFLTNLALGNNSEIDNAARLTLDKISGKEIDKKIINLIVTSPPEIQVELIRSIGERKTQSAFPNIVQTAKSTNQKVRLESYKTLELISDPNQLDQLLKVFLDIENPAELKRMENTLAKVSLKNENENERAEKFLEAFDKTNDFEKQMSLLRILGSTG